jgi:uncharacterized membrane protein YfcA
VRVKSQEEWDLIGPRAYILFPGMALLAGFLGGMLGIGGGMILNPMLIEIGMHPQVCKSFQSPVYLL